MSDGSELLFRPVDELARLVHDGELSARELVEVSLERIEALDPLLNAFVDVDADTALKAADSIAAGDPRPFAGVPLAIKTNTPVRGLTMSMGSALLAGHRPDHDAHVVRRLRAAGFVIVGMTNMPEFGILPTTEPRHTGATRNPWDTDRTPGGSSGGSAAAIAAGMVPVAHANDGGGSTRIPASCCGLVGLKPSRGRISRGPDAGDGFLVVDGALTRTVAEAAALLDVLTGYEVGDATWAPPPAEPFAAAAGRLPGRLRVTVAMDNVLGVPVDPECELAVRETAERLTSLGHEVREGGPTLPGPEMLGLFTGLFGPAISVGIAFGEQLAGRPATDDEIEPLSMTIRMLADGASSVDYLITMARLNAFSRSMVAFFDDDCDLMLTPALAERPLFIGECTGMGADPLADFARSGRFTPYTAPFNVTGQPAITIPVRFGKDDLPTSVQLVSRPLAENTLLQVAAQLEEAVELPARRPPTVVA
ncbi:MAG: amidase [Solirubrobacterales bacterium]|nr:amidase [Solirubrobacterales bacterium]